MTGDDVLTDFRRTLPTHKVIDFSPRNLSLREPVGDIYPKLKWLMFARIVITSILLGSTLIIQQKNNDISTAPYLSVLYMLIAAIFFLSLLYAMVARRIKQQSLFAYIQIAVDSFIVTLIVFITGGYFSLFSFLYLLVIIYASMILYLRGGLVMALISSLQYALLIVLQYMVILPPIGAVGEQALYSYGWPHAVYKTCITAAACFAVAILSGLLTEQTRKTQRELKAMETHVRRVEKMASMGEMAAGLAHEIRNPLASVVGSIQLLKEELHYNPDQQRLMEIILRETDRLSTLVTDFLFFARPPAGKPEKFELAKAIDHITPLFEKDTSHVRRFDLITNLQPGLWVVMDPTHLSQILWNLLLNAAEAVKDGGKIELSAGLYKNHEICVQVSDNGCGIPPDVVNSIFDPFYTTKPDGTGLGLSIVHRILEAYDSRLDVNTVENEGTTFSFLLKKANPQND